MSCVVDVKSNIEELFLPYIITGEIDIRFNRVVDGLLIYNNGVLWILIMDSKAHDGFDTHLYDNTKNFIEPKNIGTYEFENVEELLEKLFELRGSLK